MEFLFGLYLFLTGTVIVVSGAMMVVACISIFKDWRK